MPDMGSVHRLKEIVGRFSKMKVAVLGDLVADEFVYGDITRISREAPVLILEHRKTEVVPGGGGNAVANVQALGAKPMPVGIVGRDESGRRLLAAFKRRRIPLEGILVEKGYATPAKSRILAGGVHTRRQQIVRVDRGASDDPLPREVGSRLDRALKIAAGAADGLLVADYGLGAATPGRVADALSGLRGPTPPVLVDSRGRVIEYRQVAACTPNQEELERSLGLAPLADDKAVETAGRKLLRRTGNHAILVTRGALGMCLLERGRPSAFIPAFGSDEVADVTGAGDTVTAVFTLALLTGAGYVDSAKLANYAAGLVVMKAGTATVSQDELVGAVEEDLGAE